MNQQLRHLDRLGVLIVLMLCASWGFNQVSAKIAMVDFPPTTLAALRSVGGAILLGAYAFWRYPDLLKRDGTLWPGILSGLAFGGEFVALFIGLQWTTASHGILFLYAAPFFVALGLPWITPNETLSRLQWIGLALSFAAQDTLGNLFVIQVGHRVLVHDHSRDATPGIIVLA